ncbi:uncharacterized protein LOC121521237 isoform X2 [Cheilinus undulatus]|uniref:uncharacterized protein LOC121521237 isoform X2 n=1 Tax=Cheilinus undulatus TaxID=241271 RepID=UPI001BD5D087|nr:uncharacterized protein LOC121521237 isoform X2 [Cheilinus undulatus]
MESKDSLVRGGVLIVHDIHEGKHQYEVENVVKSRKGEKMFVRGDKLMQINGVDLQDLTPDELAQMLAEGNPMLTVHKTGNTKKHTPQPSPDEEILRPVSKETITLSFCMEMKREEDLQENGAGQEENGAGQEENGAGQEENGAGQEENGAGQEENGAGQDGGGGGENGDLEVDGCPAKNKASGKEGDLLVISMVKTTISVVKGRSCDSDSPCGGCNGTGCIYNDVVVVSESSRVVLGSNVPGLCGCSKPESPRVTCLQVKLVPRGSGSGLKQAKHADWTVRHAPSHLYLRGLCLQNTVHTSPNPEKITIYSYKSTYMNWFMKGKPVVLNFTGSNCFLRCCKEGERVLLRSETYEKQRLKQISRSDENTLSFVFFMKSDSTYRKFESALHQGWFIQIVNSQSVTMARRDGESEDQSFFFIIQKSA